MSKLLLNIKSNRPYFRKGKVLLFDGRSNNGKTKCRISATGPKTEKCKEPTVVALDFQYFNADCAETSE